MSETPRPASETAFYRQLDRRARLGVNGPAPLDAPQIVAFRCQVRGHFLGALYRVPEGALFVSAARHTDDELRRHKLSRKGATHPRLMKDSWSPSPRLPECDSDPANASPAPLSCRCGEWPPLARPALLAALERGRGVDHPPLVVSVSHRGLSAAGDTLCSF